MEQLLQKLQSHIKAYEKVVVGYSGGIDSTLVAVVATRALGQNALIVTALTETITQEDVELARTLAQQYHFNFREISYNELDIPEYAANPVNRCYFCKRELYSHLQKIAKEEGYSIILDGANADDVNDYRPGRQAAHEAQVRSPLIECGLTKSDVRALAQYLGLPNSDKPAAPCLSSRIPYGTPIDRKALEQIAAAERYIRSKGFINVRVRHFDHTAKIEVDAWAIDKLRELFEDVEKYLKQLGYNTVLIDEEGFRSGKLNKGIVQI